jgi:hypothetical protein
MNTFIKTQNYSIISQLEKTIHFISKTEIEISKIEQLLNPNSIIRKMISLYNMNDQLDYALLNNATLIQQI